MDKQDKTTGPDATSASAGQTLRRRAEDIGRGRPELSARDMGGLTPEAMHRTLHELQVHQIELEMQNEELRNAQLQLDTSRARYFDLYDLAPVGYCTLGPQGAILEANIAAASLLGVPRRELVGSPLQRYIAKAHQDNYHRHSQQLFASGMPQVCELQLETHGASNAWVQLSSSAAKDATGAPVQHSVLSDITDAKLMAAAMQASEERFRALLESSPDATVIVDARGCIVLVNAMTQAIFGYSRAELLGKPVDMLVPSALRSRHEMLRNGYLVKPKARHMGAGLLLHGQRKDGSEFPIDVSLSPLNTDGGVWVSCAIRDITERLHMDALLQEKNAALESARNLADQANKAKSEFLSNMSHELRTPLNAILGFGQLLDAATPPPTPTQQRSINQILQAGWYLLELINEVLDLALVESGKLSLTPAPVPLAEVLQECETMVGPQAHTRGVQLRFHAPDQAYCVKADRTRLKQVLINLLSNAIKYNQAEGTVDVRCIAIGAERVRICVEDTGTGLAADKMAQLFQPFNRLGQETGSEQGTGIGLVMTKRLVELMGGAIGADSTEGQGSVFWFEMDLTHERLARAEPVPPTARARVPTHVQQYTLLYVEDNPANLLLVEELIARRSDICLLSARNGQQGIASAQTHGPDAILLDINLPDMHGTQVLQHLAADATTAQIPVIALSANAMPSDVEKGLQAGFFNYLTKPIKLAELMDTLDAALQAKPPPPDHSHL